MEEEKKPATRGNVAGAKFVDQDGEGEDRRCAHTSGVWDEKKEYSTVPAGPGERNETERMLEKIVATAERRKREKDD